MIGALGPAGIPDCELRASRRQVQSHAVFAHVTIRAEDRAASERFYRIVLGALDIEPTHGDADVIAWDDFAILAADLEHPPTRHVHLAFVAPSREYVDAFWRAGVSAGYEDTGHPGERPQYRPDYYGAFVLDPDGNSAEAVHHGDTRRGGNLDHIWIGVSDLAAADAFYRTIARHVGLREGRRWDGGVQFRGAWATFSLVHDGRPTTKQLHIAFPAPDHSTVEDFHHAAITAGYRDHGGPGERARYHKGYFSSYVLDPDGTNVESVFHGSG
jgi:catechol 2,3-dioxygenase-like lactoylglutathione lyase family enzyme